MKQENILVFLSINDAHFPGFKPYFSGLENRTVHFVTREGVTGEDAADMAGAADYGIIEYKGKNYTGSGLSGVVKHSYDEAIILCRQSKNQRIDGFADLARFALKQAQVLYFLDISGDKREIKKRELYRHYLSDRGLKRLKKIRTAAGNLPYYIYSYMVFFLFSLVLSVLIPPLRLLGRVRSSNKENKAGICFAKRVHSDQSHILSAALRELGYTVFSVNLVGHPFDYTPCDIESDLSRKNRYARFTRLMHVYFYCFTRFDLFLFQNNGESFLVSPLFQDWQIPYLFQRIELLSMRWAGKKLVFVMRDCTVRSKESILGRGDRAYCRFCPGTRESRLCGNTRYRKNNRLAGKYAHCLLCSTVDLVEYLPPGARWLPNAYIVTDIITENPGPPPVETGDKNKPFRIVHSSTGGKNNMKGTRFLYPVIERLKEKYEIEFIVMSRLSHEEAINTIKSADVVLGQFLMGVYGNTEIESMMHGKPVIGYIDPRFKDAYPPGLPLVSIGPSDFEGELYRQLEQLITDEDYRLRLGKKTREYVVTVHGETPVARRLHEIIEALYI